ncbi:MAG TPA: ATP-binding protein [Sandaracinaceae bacterium LLY-WYZ-13_1]|nr:ATP-binding protein [Sandaracinaceae bacterium LLY-WYZ-13_1]
MLSPLATLLLTWAAIYTYVGAYYCMLHARRPTQREYLAFGLLCLGLTGWSVGAVIVTDAETLDAAVLGTRIRFAGGFAAAAFYVHFATLIAGRPAPRVVTAAYAIGGLGLLAAAAGWLVDAERVAPAPTWGLAFGRRYVEPPMTVVGHLLVVSALVPCGAAVAVMARGVRRWPDLRWLVLAAVVALLAALHDTLARLLRFQTIYLLEHAGLVPVLTVSYVLLRRFVRAADVLTERTQELRRSYSELRVTQEELVRKEQLAAVGELSAVIAHEVRNPLAIIKNAASSLRRPALGAADRGVLLGILDEEVDRLSRLVRDLLAYARPVEPQGRAVRLAELLRDAVREALGHHRDPDAITLHVETRRCPPLHGDPDLLRQALTNVADNAIQAMPEGGSLTVRTSEVRLDGHPAVAVDFDDTGAGMDEDVRAKATDPFFTTRPAGTGLGLAIVERVVKNHGGRVEIASSPSEGTHVRIVLPQERPTSSPPPPEDL